MKASKFFRILFASARSKRRHPCEKPKREPTPPKKVRHGEPFAKRKKGMERRAARRFKLSKRPWWTRDDNTMEG